MAWVRVRGRQEVPLCQSSLAVDDLWRMIADDGPAWRQLPEQVQAMGRIPVRDHRSRSALAGTHEQAYWDEYAALLPLLFLVDEEVGISDARLYRSECTVEHCKGRSSQGTGPEPGRTCLHGIHWGPAIKVGGIAP